MGTTSVVIINCFVSSRVLSVFSIIFVTGHEEGSTRGADQKANKGPQAYSRGRRTVAPRRCNPHNLAVFTFWSFISL